jgi:hypothetical protein
MKKTERHRLRLERATLRTLTGTELSGRVAGGISLVSAVNCSAGGGCGCGAVTRISTCSDPYQQ